MHKKSVEAAATLETEEVLSGTEQNSEGIAEVRARAKERNAKLLTALNGDDMNSTGEIARVQPESFRFKDL